MFNIIEMLFPVIFILIFIMIIFIFIKGIITNRGRKYKFCASVFEKSRHECSRLKIEREQKGRKRKTRETYLYILQSEREDACS